MTSMEETFIEDTENETIIHKDLFDDKGWIDFYHNNHNILEDIVTIFNQGTYKFIRYNGELGLTTAYISLVLDKPILYIRHQLAIWYNSPCTFYAKYGRINYIKEKEIWVHKPKS